MMGLFDLASPGEVGIVTELATGGSLAEKLRLARKGQTFPALARARVLGHVAEGVSFLHAQGLVHRDIKPANVLLFSNGDAKIGDLGLAAIEGEREGLTRSYAAPELLLRTGRSSTASDVYSYGMTVYETMTLARLPRGHDRAGREELPPWEGATVLDAPRPGPWWADTLIASLAVEERPTMLDWKVVWEAVAKAGHLMLTSLLALLLSSGGTKRWRLMSPRTDRLRCPACQHCALPANMLRRWKWWTRA